MNRLSKIFLVIIIILLIALSIVSCAYFRMRESSKRGLESTLNSAEELYEANKRIHELEEQLNISE